MKETLRYLAGIAGPSGYGSKSTADQVTQDCSSFLHYSHLTAIITGIHLLSFHPLNYTKEEEDERLYIYIYICTIHVCVQLFTDLL